MGAFAEGVLETMKRLAFFEFIDTSPVTNQITSVVTGVPVMEIQCENETVGSSEDDCLEYQI